MKRVLVSGFIFMLAGFAHAEPTTFAGIDLRTKNSIEIGKSTDKPLIKTGEKSPEKTATLVLFLSSKCPCSMSHMEEIKSLAAKYPNVSFVGINSNVDETLEASHTYFSALGLSFPVIRDEKLKLADTFKAVKTPHAYLLDEQGTKLFQGGVSNSAKFPQADRFFLREALSQWDKGKEIEQKVARALGCAIVREIKN